MEEDYKKWPAPLRKAMVSLRKAGGCGANAQGGGGFQKGNNCASGGDGGSKRPVDREAMRDYLSDTLYTDKQLETGYRIQRANAEIPMKSENRWTDDDEEMQGTIAFSNSFAAIYDIAFGKEDSTTDTNYTDVIEDDGGEAELVVLIGKSVDAPGDEKQMVDHKTAAAFTKDQVREAVRQAMRDRYANEFPDEVGSLLTAEWDVVVDEWEDQIDENDFQDVLESAEQILRGSLR